MASYEIRWRRSAKKELRKLPQEARRRLLKAIERLREDARPPGCRKMVGSQSAYRLRVGDYRIVYTILAGELVIEIVRVGSRKDAYR